jgi:hypothetical protein
MNDLTLKIIELSMLIGVNKHKVVLLILPISTKVGRKDKFVFKNF